MPFGGALAGNGRKLEPVVVIRQVCEPLPRSCEEVILMSPAVLTFSPATSATPLRDFREHLICDLLLAGHGRMGQAVRAAGQGG